jgi:lipopolysaccharide transport system permease protein
MNWSYKINNQPKKIYQFFFDIYKYRSMFKQLISRDLKVTFAQSFFGPLYFIFFPFIQAIIFNFLLTNIANLKSSSDVPNYLFYLSGFLFWNYFSTAASRSSAGILLNIKIIQQISIPRVIFLLTPIVYSLINFFVTFFIFIAFNILYSLYFDFAFNFSIKFLIILPLILYCFILAFIYGLIVSALSIKFRDIIYANQLIFQTIMIGSCVLYSADQLYKINFSWILYLNPFILVTESFRWALFNSSFNLEIIHIVSQITIVILSILFGVNYFLNNERKMVDLI